MGSKSLQRSDPLTLERWERLPFLIPRAVVVEWTGLNWREIEEEVKAGRLRVFGAKRKKKFFRSDVGRLAGIPGALRQIHPDSPRFTPIGTRPLDTGGSTCST